MCVTGITCRDGEVWCEVEDYSLQSTGKVVVAEDSSFDRQVLACSLAPSVPERAWALSPRRRAHGRGERQSRRYGVLYAHLLAQAGHGQVEGKIPGTMDGWMDGSWDGPLSHARPWRLIDSVFSPTA